jgi:DNA processing protein
VNVDETLDALTLALLPGLAARRVKELRARGPLHEAVCRPEAHADLLAPEHVDALRSGAPRRRAEHELAQARQRGVQIVGCADAAYPDLLSRIYAPPPVLYVKGRLLPDEGERSLALVGARAATPAGLTLARHMARQLAAAGATIVSGLARGVDTAAHRGALDVAGRTLAVLGSALDRVYPAENARLVDAIAERGAVVSEFPLGTAPLPRHFPRRNRVIAGLSRAVVVVEAGEKSGSLTTASSALEEGRDVLAVPGHPSSPLAAGTNRLIRDGAALVRDAVDVASELGFVIPVTRDAGLPADDVLSALPGDAPSSLEELQRRVGRPLPELLTRLGELELASKVRRLPGGLFVRT